MTINWLNVDTKKWSYIGSQNKTWRMAKVRVGAYLGSEWVLRHHEMGLVHKNEYKIYHMHHQTEYEITNGTHDISLKFIFILSKTSLMLGPTKTQFILHELVSQISLFRNYEKFILTYVKSRETEVYLRTRVELKLFEGKLDFWNLFENGSLNSKLEYWELNLRIWVFKIIWELEFWKLNLRIEILEIKFERN